MHIHIAIFKWKPGIEQADIEAALKAVEALHEKVPGVIEISTGQNTSRYNKGYSHVVLVRAKSQEAIDNYRKHPDHYRVAADIESMEEHSIGVDFETR